MSQYIAIVRGEDREEYVEHAPRLTKSKESAMRFDTSMEAREAAAAVAGAVLDHGPNEYPRLYPWITDVDSEEIK